MFFSKILHFFKWHFLTILLLILMSWMRGEQYRCLFYCKNTRMCTSQVFIIIPVGVKKITLPFIFLPSLISQPEWQLSRIGEEKERKKYTQEDGTVQVLSKTIGPSTCKQTNTSNYKPPLDISPHPNVLKWIGFIWLYQA